jgi:hypothetical protein
MFIAKLRQYTLFCFLAVALLTASTLPVRAGIILPLSQTDYFVMMESAAEFGAFLGLTFVTDPPTTQTQTLSWTGTFDQNGWTLHYTGNYNDDPLQFSMTGSYKLAGTIDPIHDVVTWIGGGSLGPIPLSSNGEAVIIDDWTWKDTVAVVAGVVLVAGIGAEVIQPELAPISVKAIQVTGQVIKHVATKAFETKAVVLVGTSLAAATVLDSKAHASEITNIQVSSVSNGNIVSGTVTGTTDVTVTPEPSTWLLLMTGLVGLLALEWRHRWRGLQRRRLDV